MKRRIIFSLISLILAVAMVITALSSCSADNSSLILCNVKLEEDEYSRRLTSTVTSNTISASAIYYHPEYLGTGSSYSEINSDKTSITDDVTGEKYILYNDNIAKKEYQNIMILIFTILVIIYYHFSNDSYEDLENLNEKDSEKKKNLTFMSFIGSVLVLLSGLIFLTIVIIDDNIDTEIAFN